MGDAASMGVNDPLSREKERRPRPVIPAATLPGPGASTIPPLATETCTPPPSVSAAPTSVRELTATLTFRV